jgi:hypothetical protein
VAVVSSVTGSDDRRQLVLTAIPEPVSYVLPRLRLSLGVLLSRLDGQQHIIMLRYRSRNDQCMITIGDAGSGNA